LPASDELADATLVASYPEAGSKCFAYRREPVRLPRSAQDCLKAAPDVRFAGGVLVDPKSGEPVLYTENLFVKFVDTADADAVA